MTSININFILDEQPNVVYKLSDTIVINIVKLTAGYSLVYFTDEMNNKINVPKDVMVYEYGITVGEYRIALNTIDKDFFHLFCSNNYKVEYNSISVNILSRTAN
jgi:hypothetical protein